MASHDLPEDWAVKSHYFGESTTANLAHDLKNLLTVLRGCVDALDSQTPHNPATAACVSDIRCAIDCAFEIAWELLGFGRRSNHTPVIEINDALDNISATLSRFLSPRISLKVSLGATSDTVAIHPLELERILFNLVLNAREAMWNGGRLTIETTTVTRPLSGLTRPEPLRSFVRLTVSDTGQGIPALMQAKVFEAFYTTKADAAGLGLSVVAKTVDRLHGVVHLESQEGVGTRVHVDFPLAVES